MGVVLDMGKVVRGHPRRVVIASVNPLFGKGLQNMLQKRWGQGATIIRLTSNLEETLHALDDLLPDLMIVDFDDQTMNRKEFLKHFIASEQPMQLMLISLKDSGQVVVYDRKTLSPSQAENWLGEQ